MNSIPIWATEIRERLARIEQKLDDHIRAHRHNSNNELRKVVALGIGMGAGIAGMGTALLKLIGL